MSICAEEKKEPKLVLNNICKNFGGVVAASDICLDIYGGETMGLIGPNGAGKTTLINLITGVYRADSGQILFKGKDVSKEPTYKRAIRGMGRTFQHPHHFQ